MLKMGFDTEFFASDSKGELMSFAGKLRADKHHPRQIGGFQMPAPALDFLDRHVKVFVQEDGISVELTTTPFDPGDAIHVIPQAVAILKSFLKTEFDATILPTDEVSLSEEMDSAPQHRIIGCDSDYAAYDLGGRRNPFLIKDFNRQRFGSGHIHINLKEVWKEHDMPEDHIPEWVVAQFCDILIGLPLLHGCCAKTNNRKRFYGSAGIFRPKPYGIEYRTPPNLWAFSPPMFHNPLWVLEDFLLKTREEIAEIYKNINWKLVEGAFLDKGAIGPAISQFYQLTHYDPIGVL